MIKKNKKEKSGKYKNVIRFSKLIVKKNKARLIFSFILVVLISIINLVLPQLTKYIVDDGIAKGNIPLLVKLIIFYFVISVSSALFNLMLEYFYSIMKNKVIVDLKMRVLNHLSKLSGNYYSNIKTGNILSITQDDMSIIENFDASLVFSIIDDLFTSVVSIVFLIQMRFDLFLIVLILQIFLTLIQNKFIKKISSKVAKMREKYGENSNLLQEYISNMMNIVLSKSKLKFFRTYLKKERSLIKRYIDIDIAMVENVLIARVFSALVMICIYGYGGYMIIKNNMTIGTLLAFQQYTNMFIGPCINIIRSNNRIQQAKVSIDRVYTLLDEEIEIKTDNKAYILTRGNINEIKFKDIYFTYLNEEKSNNDYILNGISMEFKKGTSSAIVGGSGCGKTTLINLLYRLWDVNKGEISIDGRNIKDINLLSLRKNINVVSQDIFMFDDSIRSNILISKKISDESILKICEVVGLTDFIEGLQDGLDTIIGEKGVKISGGQKQRISLARALVNDSEILILDEATSALDNLSQENILRNMKEYLKDKIVIIIAHRLSTIKDVDNIYVLYKGKVAESGSEVELEINDGIYSKLAKADI